MRLITFERDGALAAGFIEDESAVVCAEGPAAETAVRDVIAGGPEALAGWRARAADAPRAPLAEVALRAPMPSLVRNVWCVGLNYHAHAAEAARTGGFSPEPPKHPVFFTKATTALIGPGETIRASLDPTQSVDYEGELGVVIGRRCFGLKPDEAMEAVAGYVLVNDVTSRRLQKRHAQWVIGKSLDTFCPMGPWIATADEVPDVTALRLRAAVNGEVRQDACVSDLIFDIPTLVSTLSSYVTLLPGDVIATGTPEGVGMGFNPPRWLQPGDVVSVEIAGLGRLENPVG